MTADRWCVTQVPAFVQVRRPAVYHGVRGHTQTELCVARAPSESEGGVAVDNRLLIAGKWTNSSMGAGRERRLSQVLDEHQPRHPFHGMG